ncbi:hypothetical protein [Planococcus halotolerans]|uniref:Uncharacterized protein n=1 Tax=Planococcus halotolerans TaxID=2233542 RepID=A0A365L353_9BACL|nr:hypothetical protein [Planococcus halotolerans]QHJ70627.1 hypothetical protein DNR44_008440 [Planococcus halotolerans]RAZ79615.1 hypothetical protein DP120_08405 [Planococcus halotolerans]
MARNDNGDKSMVDKILDSVNQKENIDGERHDHRDRNEKHVIENEHENAPDEGKEDVPTEDKIIRDPETGEETFIKNDNKNWKLK